jgi:exosortase C (VPDSG-CTERM-specific)
VAAVAGAITLVAAYRPPASWGGYSQNDFLAILATAFVCCVVAGGFLFLGRQWMVAAAFPIGFLIFLAPLPDAAVHALETASKYASADAAYLFFELTGTPILRDGLFFKIPGITLEVAQECSGIRSSWVLFITSLVASYLFLDSSWRRAVLVALVFPLAIIRNGFRILVIGLLCVHIGPEMINSVIHKRGGPLFFALSLIPLFAIMWLLRRGERRETGERTLDTGEQIPDTGKK